MHTTKSREFYAALRASRWCQETAGMVLFSLFILFSSFLQTPCCWIPPSTFVELAPERILGQGQLYCGSCSPCHWVAESDPFGLTGCLCAQWLSHPLPLDLVERTVCWSWWWAELFWIPAWSASSSVEVFVGGFVRGLCGTQALSWEKYPEGAGVLYAGLLTAAPWEWSWGPSTGRRWDGPCCWDIEAFAGSQ